MVHLPWRSLFIIVTVVLNDGKSSRSITNYILENLFILLPLLMVAIKLRFPNDELEAHKKAIEQEILLLAEPFTAVLDFLYTLSGLDKTPMTAIAILSEISPDMSVFPSSKNLVSWAGCCPRNDQSNQKVKSTHISHAGSYLKPPLVQIPSSLIKPKKQPEFKERYHRIKFHRGHKKAIIAVYKMLLTAI